MRKHIVDCKIENENDEELVVELTPNINERWVESIDHYMSKVNISAEQKVEILDMIIDNVIKYNA